MEWLMACSLASLAYIYALSSGTFLALAVALLVGLAIPGGIITIRQQFKMRSNAYNTLMTVFLATFLLFNVLINQGNYSGDPTFTEAVAHIIGFIIYLFILNWIASNLDVRRVLSKLALVLVPLTFLGLINPIASAVGRYKPYGLQPNWWGELMVALSISTLAVRSIVVRVAIYLLAVLVLYFVQSRSGMVGVSIVLAIDGIRTWKYSNAVGRVGMVSLAILIIFIGFGFTPLASFITDKILLLNDPYRGLGTGFTGRVQGWQEALDAFSNNPIFGQGMDIYRYVHNGFLQVVAEGGIVLGVTVFVLLIHGLHTAWLDMNYIKFAGLLAVAGYVSFQPRMFNLNLTSLIFWLSIRDWRITGNVSDIEYLRWVIWGRDLDAS